LGIDTHQQVGCALGGHEGVITSVSSQRGRRHAKAWRHRSSSCWARPTWCSPTGAIAVDLGPSLFCQAAGGHATAKMLAHAGIPVLGVSSLDLVAFAVQLTRLIVAVDARRSGSTCAYRQVPGGIQRIGEHRIGSPDELASELMASGEEVLLVGDGAHRYREQFAAIPRVELADQGWSAPCARSLVQLAHARALREEFDAGSTVMPIYLRRPDAEINWDTREGRHRA
jgi:tRNA threonylcarbamoyladenosine biosynthesis protein TsaB